MAQVLQENNPNPGIERLAAELEKATSAKCCVLQGAGRCLSRERRTSEIGCGLASGCQAQTGFRMAASPSRYPAERCRSIGAGPRVAAMRHPGGAERSASGSNLACLPRSTGVPGKLFRVCGAPSRSIRICRMRRIALVRIFRRPETLSVRKPRSGRRLGSIRIMRPPTEIRRCFWPPGAIWNRPHITSGKRCVCRRHTLQIATNTL